MNDNDFASAFQERYNTQGAGGQVLADELRALPPDQFAQAYNAAHVAKYGAPADGLPNFAPPAGDVQAGPTLPDRIGASVQQSLQEPNSPLRLNIAAAQGVVGAAHEIKRTATALARAATDAVAAGNPYAQMIRDAFGGLEDPGALPEVLPDKSMPEGILQSITQFTSAFVPLAQLFKGYQLFKVAENAPAFLKGTASVANSALASVPVDFAAFDPVSNNLADVAQQYGFLPELTQFLASKPDDGEALTQLENRVKAAAANLVPGTAMAAAPKVAAQLYVASANTMRAVRNADWATIEQKAAQDIKAAREPGRMNDVGGAVQQGAKMLSAATRLVASRMMRRAAYDDVLEPLTPEQRVQVVDAAQEQADAGVVRSSVDPKDVLPKKEYQLSGLAILRGEEEVPKDVKGVAGATRFLQDRAMKLLKGEAGADTPKAQKRIARLLAAHVAEAVSSTGNAGTWYRDKLRLAHRIVAQQHPEILTDEPSRTAFNYALAVTSNGQTVPLNAKLALDAYETWKRTGKFAETGNGKEAAAMTAHFKLWNQMVDELGFDDWMKFLNSEWKVSDLKQLGFEVGGESADTRVPGAVVLGPKIGGAFFANLQGDMQRLTMDRWWERMFRAFKGDLTYPPEIVAGRTERFRKSFDLPGVEAMASKYAGMSVAELRALPDQELQKVASRVYSKWGQDKTSATGGGHPVSGTPADEFMRSAREVHKAAFEPIGAPESAAARDFRRATTQEALKILKKTYGIETDPADLQALVWYPTKELWSRLNVRESEQIAYDEAFNRLMQERGYAGLPDSELARPQSDSGGYSQTTFSAAEQQRFQRARVARALAGQFGSGDAGRKPGYEPRATAGSVADPVTGQKVKGTKLTPATGLKNALQSAGVSTPPLVQVEAPDTFHRAIVRAKESQGPLGAAVTVYDPTDYAAARTFLTEDATAGFALKDDDIVSVFNTAGGPHRAASLPMLHAAVAQGGKRLDCFNTELPRLYQMAGMKPVARLKWNEEYAPPGWDKTRMMPYNGGEPDVVFMVYDPDNAARVKVNDVPFVRDYDAGVDAQRRSLPGYVDTSFESARKAQTGQRWEVYDLDGDPSAPLEADPMYRVFATKREARQYIQANPDKNLDMEHFGGRDLNAPPQTELTQDDLEELTDLVKAAKEQLKGQKVSDTLLRRLEAAKGAPK